MWVGDVAEIGHLFAVLCYFRVYIYIMNLKCSVCWRHLEPRTVCTWAVSAQQLHFSPLTGFYTRSLSSQWFLAETLLKLHVILHHVSNISVYDVNMGNLCTPKTQRCEISHWLPQGRRSCSRVSALIFRNTEFVSASTRKVSLDTKYKVWIRFDHLNPSLK